jgi:hypothetical protein
LDDFAKKYRAAGKPAQPLRNPCEVSGEHAGGNVLRQQFVDEMKKTV